VPEGFAQKRPAKADFLGRSRGFWALHSNPPKTILHPLLFVQVAGFLCRFYPSTKLYRITPRCKREVYIPEMRILRFFKDAGRLAVSSEIAAVIFYGIAWWEHAKDKPISAYLFISLSVVLVWLGGFLAWRKKDIRVEELENAQSSSCAGGPEIFLGWGIPRNVSGLGIAKRQFMAENRSSVDAYDVKIEDVSIDASKVVTAQFVEINMIPKNSTTQVETRVVGKVNPSLDDQFDMVYFEADQIRPEYEWKDDKGNEGVKIPLTLTCRDYAGHVYRSIFEFTDDKSGLSLSAVVRFIKCERLS